MSADAFDRITREAAERLNAKLEAEAFATATALSVQNRADRLQSERVGEVARAAAERLADSLSRY